METICKEALDLLKENGLTVGEVDGTDHFDPAEKLLKDMTPGEQVERIRWFIDNCSEPF